MDKATPQQVGAPLLAQVVPQQPSPQDILRQIWEKTQGSIDAQRQQADATKAQLEKTQGQKQPFNFAPLAMAVDAFAGTNTAPIAQAMNQMNEDPRAEAARLQELLRKQQQGISDDELGLLRAQYQQASGAQGMGFADKQALLQKNKLDYLGKQFDFNSQLKAMGLNAKSKKRGTGKRVGDNGEELKELTANMVKKLNVGNQIPLMLEDVGNTIEANKDTFGPFTGRIASMNPYNEQSKTIDSQMRAVSQAFGRFMEGGVLRKEDEEKYRKMFPALSDTPEIATNKLAVVKRLLQQQQQSDLGAFSDQGYDITGLDRGFALPNVPEVLKGGEASSISAPAVGTEKNGYRFKGGDPGDPSSWEKM